MTAAVTAASLEPLVIYITHGFDSYTFFVDREQLHRVRPADSGADTLPDRITIALDQKRPFAEVFEPIHRHVIALLTGQDPAALRSAGGVEVRDYDAQSTLWRQV